jgi:large subunit ribosomal protein L27
MAHTKALGSTKLGRESRSQRLGVKIQDGCPVSVGEIIIRQRGAKYIAGRNVGCGGDDTLFALKTGVVKFSEKSKVRFDGSRRKATFVAVVAQ